RNGGKRRVHRGADCRVDQRRIAIDPIEQRALLDRADHAAVGAVAVAFDDRQLADAVILHRVDGGAHAVPRLHADERWQRSTPLLAALPEAVADGMRPALLETTV